MGSALRALSAASRAASPRSVGRSKRRLMNRRTDPVSYCVWSMKWRFAKGNIHLDGRRTPVLSAHERGADAMSALDLALDKIDRQVVKYKEKVTHRKKPVSPVRVPMADADKEARSPEPERIRMKLRPMTISDAVDELEADGQAFLVFLDEDSGAIEIVARRADGSVAVIEPVVT